MEVSINNKINNHEANELAEIDRKNNEEL